MNYEQIIKYFERNYPDEDLTYIKEYYSNLPNYLDNLLNEQIYMQQAFFQILMNKKNGVSPLINEFFDLERQRLFNRYSIEEINNFIDKGVVR